jgi:hypothetical protein
MCVIANNVIGLCDVRAESDDYSSNQWRGPAANRPWGYNRSGPISTLSEPRGLAIDMKNNQIYVADQANHAIYSLPRLKKQSDSAGIVLTEPKLVAGQKSRRGQIEGKALTDAQFDQPYGLALDENDGTLFIADSANHVVRGLSATGDVYSMVGSGSYGCCQGTGPLAEFYSPTSLSLHARSVDSSSFPPANKYLTQNRMSILHRTYQMVVTEAKSNILRLIDVSGNLSPFAASTFMLLMPRARGVCSPCLVPRKQFLVLVSRYSEAPSMRQLPSDVVGIIVQYTHRVHTSNLPDEYRFNLSV